MKKLLVFLLIFTMLLPTLPVFAQEEITVVVNMEKVEFDVLPMTVNGRTMVPLRAIFEKLGAEVSYDDETREITAKKDETVIKLTVDSDKMYVNEEEKLLDSPAFEEGGRTLVPVRAISEAFGCIVNWYDNEKTVEIFDTQKVIGTVSNDFGKKDVYQFELNLLIKADDYSQEEAYDMIKLIKTYNLKAEEYNYALSEEELSEVSAQIDILVEQCGSKEALNEELCYYGANADEYAEYLTEIKVYSSFRNNVTEIGVIKGISDDEIKEYFDKTFIKAKHILISDQKTAYEVYNKIKKGADFENYRHLCEDPGSETNPDGYLFVNTKNVDVNSYEYGYYAYYGMIMVEEFEQGAAALKAGQISMPIKTPYGYHIIKRERFTEKEYEGYSELARIIGNEKRIRAEEENWLKESKFEMTF